MELDIAPWLNLAVRWLHFIAGIAWIGSSFYFVWLDNQLRPAKVAKEGVSGEVWSVHGGGFYHKQKYAVAPPAMPDELHWFKWEAYTTWISGFFLLGIIYYLGADLFLIDRTKVDFTPPVAIAISLGTLVAGWVVYDLLCRSPLGDRNAAFGAVWFAVLVVAAWGLDQVFSDRAAFIHVGAIIGTAMVANVFFVIIPNQKKVVDALTRGETPDPTLGAKGKQRSVHNNYMTLPVLFIMVSNHYPMTFSNPYGWAVLAGIGATGWVIRHFFNLRNQGTVNKALPVAATALFIATMIFADWAQRSTQVTIEDAVSFTEIEGILQTHCTTCHSVTPTHEFFEEAPIGVMLDTPAQMQQYAPKILEQTVQSDIMPLGNETGMTAAERALLGKWIEDGANIE